MINFFFKKAPPEDWRRKLYYAEKHRNKTENAPSRSHQPINSNFTWATGLILFLLLTSRLPRGHAAQSRSSTGSTDLANQHSQEVYVPLVTAFIFNSCPADRAPDAPKHPKADLKQLLEKKKAGKKLSKRQKKRLRKLLNSSVKTEVKEAFTATEILIQDKMVGNASPEHRKAVVDTIMQLRSAHPDIQYMIDTVLNQLPGMQILLAPQADILSQSKDVNLGAFYSTPLRCIVVSENTTAGTLLHEFRHAFWHTYQIAQSPNKMTLSTQVWNRNLNDQRRLAIENYFSLGDERIRTLLNPQLRNKVELQKVKALFDSAPEHYKPIFRKKALIGYESDCAEYPRGKPYKRDPALTVNSCQVVLKNDRGSIIRHHSTEDSQYLLIETNEPNPLKNVLEQIVISINSIRTHYHPDHYYFERDAYIFGILPIPLIEQFYPEFIEYSRQLTKNIQVSHTPFPTNRGELGDFSGFIDQRLRMLDIKFIAQLWPEEQLKIAAYQADDLWAAGENYDQILKPILDYLLKLQFQVADVFERLITISCKEANHEKVLSLAQELDQRYRNIKLNLDLSRCLIRSFYHLRLYDLVCTYAVRLLSEINASFDHLVQEHGLESTLDNKKFSQEMIQSYCLRQ